MSRQQPVWRQVAAQPRISANPVRLLTVGCWRMRATRCWRHWWDISKKRSSRWYRSRRASSHRPSGEHSPQHAFSVYAGTRIWLPFGLAVEAMPDDLMQGLLTHAPPIAGMWMGGGSDAFAAEMAAIRGGV